MQWRPQPSLPRCDFLQNCRDLSFSVPTSDTLQNPFDVQNNRLLSLSFSLLSHPNSSEGPSLHSQNVPEVFSKQKEQLSPRGMWSSWSKWLKLESVLKWWLFPLLCTHDSMNGILWIRWWPASSLEHLLIQSYSLRPAGEEASKSQALVPGGSVPEEQNLPSSMAVFGLTLLLTLVTWLFAFAQFSEPFKASLFSSTKWREECLTSCCSICPSRWLHFLDYLHIVFSFVI